MYGSGYDRAKEISIDKTLFHRCKTLPNRQCRHTGEGRYPVLSSAGFRVKPGMTGGGIIQSSHPGAGQSPLYECEFWRFFPQVMLYS